MPDPWIDLLACLELESKPSDDSGVALQPSRGVLATSSICMHAVEDGPEHQDVASVPPVLGQEHRMALDLIPWETRAVVDLSATSTGPPDFEFWMRTPEVDPELAPPLAAYATDLTLIGTALRPMEGLGQCGNGTQSTSAVTSRHGVVAPALTDR